MGQRASQHEPALGEDAGGNGIEPVSETAQTQQIAPDTEEADETASRSTPSKMAGAREQEEATEYHRRLPARGDAPHRRQRPEGVPR